MASLLVVTPRNRRAYAVVVAHILSRKTSQTGPPAPYVVVGLAARPGGPGVDPVAAPVPRHDVSAVGPRRPRRAVGRGRPVGTARVCRPGRDAAPDGLVHRVAGRRLAVFLAPVGHAFADDADGRRPGPVGHAVTVVGPGRRLNKTTAAGRGTVERPGRPTALARPRPRADRPAPGLPKAETSRGHVETRPTETWKGPPHVPADTVVACRPLETGRPAARPSSAPAPTPTPPGRTTGVAVAAPRTQVAAPEARAVDAKGNFELYCVVGAVS